MYTACESNRRARSSSDRPEVPDHLARDPAFAGTCQQCQYGQLPWLRCGTSQWQSLTAQHGELSETRDADQEPVSLGSTPDDVANIPRRQEQEREDQHRTLNGGAPHSRRKRVGRHGGRQRQAEQSAERGTGDEEPG